MFRFLKGLVKGEEPAAAIGIDDLPAWIRGEEEEVREGLAALVAGRRPVVLRARDRMEEVLAGFDAASMEEVSHRKLAGVTERSLPLFLKAVHTSLSRDLPGDPEGFYAAAGEILKGCLSAFRGQGRYLASRFPEEMKVLRDGVDAIGKEVNALTPEIARARDRLRGLAGLRGSLERYADAKRRIAVLREVTRSLEEEKAKARTDLDGVTRALHELERGASYRAYEEELSRIRGLEEERTETVRLFHATAAPAAHLMRKGEKIASRKGDRDAVRVLHEAAELLEGEVPIRGDMASRALPPAQGAMAALVASGDLTPKNREEMDLAERPGQLLPRITGISRRFGDISREITSAGDALQALPVHVKRVDLRKEAEDLEKRIARVMDRLEHERREAAGLGERLRASLDEVRRQAGALSARPVEVGEPVVP
jgi:predicted  nucleic acid-binding Zn-ribbon protein